MKHYKGTIGTEVLVDVKENIITATTVLLKVTKPSGIVVNWTDCRVKELTKISYIIKSGDWDEAGEYRLQAYVELPDWSGLGETATFTIYDPFK